MNASRDLNMLQKNDRGKRFEYLLKQTEIFSHFMMNASKTSSSGSPPKQKGRPRKEPVAGAGAGAGDPGEYVLAYDNVYFCLIPDLI